MHGLVPLAKILPAPLIGIILRLLAEESWMHWVVVERFEFIIKNGRLECSVVEHSSPSCSRFLFIFYELVSWMFVVGEKAGGLVCCDRVSSSHKKMTAKVTYITSETWRSLFKHKYEYLIYNQFIIHIPSQMYDLSSILILLSYQYKWFRNFILHNI